MPKEPGAKQQQAVKEPGGFILNSYQTPNDYVDRFLHLYTGEELKVLTYTVRRIFGFQKRQDHISISQYQHGLFDEEGNRLDHGTGLARGTVIKALASLVKYRLMVFVGSNDPRRNDGDCYALQLDASSVDVEGLLKREEEKRQANTLRTAAALSSKASARRKHTHTPSPLHLSDPRSVRRTTPGLSDVPAPESPVEPPPPAEPVCRTDSTRSVQQTETGTSDRHTITRGNTGEIQHTHTPRAREAPPPRKPVCVCSLPHASEFCGPVRLDYARNHREKIKNPEGWAYSERVAGGEFDDLIRPWVERGRHVGKEPPRDASTCPDCEGRGLWEPGGQGKGFARCSHPRLVDAEARREALPARASP